MNQEKEVVGSIDPITKAAVAASYPLGVSAAQIKEWKAKYGSVHYIGLPDFNGKEVGAYFKPATWDVLKVVKAVAQSKGEIESSLELYVECLLLASEEINQYDSLKMSIMEQMTVIVGEGKALTKKF